ncbi:alpha/beta fold hydrolase [Streptomyces sp. SL13]|uniref:Alpha/beta fold hydrolase n=1 Tax=Streptantibioticus silvisoli TaxID=2705255 RepID=A0AA90H9N4_9ACTN|nr:alpha/beta fold hydrolase [Streptantibioticus silvisoli]MDI5973418.1 alpha/beta fold hydrolase [Streptantibioticus silvisoli]
MTSTGTASFANLTPAGLPGLTLAYERHGAGEPLVLLHGIGHHRQAWDPVVAALAERREVVTVDLPGFGESPAQPAGLPYSLDTAVTVFGAFFDALGLRVPHVAGNSLGGLIALRLAQAGRARSVTALSPGGFWNAPEAVYTFTLLKAMRRGALALPPGAIERMARRPLGRRALTGAICADPVRRDPRTVVAETMAMREATGFDATLAVGSGGGRFRGGVDERTPVTIAWGDRDRMLPRRQGVRAGHAIPHARLIRLPRCGHVPMNDDPALVARVLLEGSR